MTGEPVAAVQQFKEIAAVVGSGPATASVLDSVKAIDFLLFTIDDIKLVEESAWLPDDVKVEILHQWVTAQSALLLDVHGRISLQAEFPVAEAKHLWDALAQPGIAGRCTVLPNIFQLLGSGGGHGPFVNPIVGGLLKVEVDPHSDEPAPDSEFGYYNAFDCNEATIYRSASASARRIRFFLPDFIKVKLMSLTISCPVKGVRSWKIQGRPDVSTPWIDIDARTNTTEFSQPAVRATFEFEAKDYYREFQFEQVDQNHQGNLSIYLGTIDIGGNILIVK
jgi:hypothetical protein